MKKVKVIINAKVCDKKSRGITRYAEDIIEAITKFDDFQWEIIKPKPVRFYRAFWEHFIIPRICRKECADILFCPDIAVPILNLPPQLKVVVTVHDLRWKYLPEASKWHLNKYLDFLLSNAVKKATALVAVSNYTKKSIIEYFPQARDKIDVVYEFICKDKFKFLNMPRKKKILFVGTISRHKNIHGILKAFLKIHDKIPHNLIIAGEEVPVLQTTKEMKECLNLIPPDRVEFTGFLSDDRLIKLYNESDFFVFPSFYEGFGLPPLEAMACGLPVLVSNVTSLPEVCGDAALYCDPYANDDIAKKMLELAVDDGVKESMRQKGFQRVGQFNSDEAAKRLIEIFRKMTA